MRRQMPFQPPRPEAVAVPVDASNENAEVIAQAAAVNIPGQSKRGGKGNKTARGNGKRVSQRGKAFSKEEDRIIHSMTKKKIVPTAVYCLLPMPLQQRRL